MMNMMMLMTVILNLINNNPLRRHALRSLSLYFSEQKSALISGITTATTAAVVVMYTAVARDRGRCLRRQNGV